MVEKYSLRDGYELFVTLSLFLPVHCLPILVISSLYVAGQPFAAGLDFLTLCPLMAFIYVVDRWSVSEEDRINNPHRTALVERYSTELMGLAVVSLAVFELSLLVSLSSRGVASLGVFALGHVPLVVLSLYDDVKALPLPLDSLAVAFAWSFEIAYVFAFVSPHPTTAKELTVLFVSWFLLVFAGVEARNTEDVEGDRKAGKVTLAVMLGQRRAKLLAVVLKAGGVALLSMAAGTVLVSVLVVLHLLSLRFFRTLEVDCRDRTRPTVSPENVRPQYRERDEQPATEQSGVTK